MFSPKPIKAEVETGPDLVMFEIPPRAQIDPYLEATPKCVLQSRISAFLVNTSG